MKEFDVTITETLKLTVSVEASSKEEAQQMVSDQWHAGDHILDADNFVEVEFESNDGKEISAERAQNDTIEVLMVELSGIFQLDLERRIKRKKKKQRKRNLSLHILHQ